MTTTHSHDHDATVPETYAWAFIFATAFGTAALLLASTIGGWGVGIGGLEHPAVNVAAALLIPAWAIGAYLHARGET